MTGISMLVFLTEAPCLSCRATLVGYRLLSSLSAPMSWRVQITFDPQLIRDVLLCASVYSQQSHSPDFS